jgi:hypothetical protein
MGTLCQSGAALFKAGANVSTALVEADYDFAILQAEGQINTISRYNWIDAFSGLNVDVKFILEEVCSNLAAIYLINYDMSGYNSRAEAQTMMDVLRDRAEKGLSLIKDIKQQDFINNA